MIGTVPWVALNGALAIWILVDTLSARAERRRQATAIRQIRYALGSLERQTEVLKMRTQPTAEFPRVNKLDPGQDITVFSDRIRPVTR